GGSAALPASRSCGARSAAPRRWTSRSPRFRPQTSADRAASHGGPRGVGPMEALWQDLRFALRSLGRSRLFTAIAVGTLALSVGGVTTVFSVVHAALFRPLPFAESHRLMLLYITATQPGGPTYNRRWSFPR